MAMWSVREYVAGAAFRGPDVVAAAVLERMVEECLCYRDPNEERAN